MEVIRVRNPAALNLPDVQALWRRALDKAHFAGGNFDLALGEFKAMVGHEKAGIFLGFEEDSPKGLFIISPTYPLFPIPQVWHAYNEGKPALARLMMIRGIEFLRSEGYTKVHAGNGTGIPADVWQRVFRLKDNLKTVCTMYEIDLNELWIRQNTATEH